MSNLAERAMELLNKLHTERLEYHEYSLLADAILKLMEYEELIEEKQQDNKKYLEEACRQWCDFIDEAPERKDGIGFADFYEEIKRQMIKEEIYRRVVYGNCSGC